MITKNLPDNYSPAYSIDLSTNFKMAVILNLAGLVIMGITLCGLGIFIQQIRPGFFQPYQNLTINLGSLYDLLWLLLLVLTIMVVHELIHGFFFWFYTHAKPAFGLSLSYAYAAAPEWYFPIHSYWIIGLAPLILIALGGLLVIVSGPPSWVFSTLIMISFNTGGAVGDMWIIGSLLARGSKYTLVNDTGHKVTFYNPDI